MLDLQLVLAKILHLNQFVRFVAIRPRIMFRHYSKIRCFSWPIVWASIHKTKPYTPYRFYQNHLPLSIYFLSSHPPKCRKQNPIYATARPVLAQLAIINKPPNSSQANGLLLLLRLARLILGFFLTIPADHTCMRVSTRISQNKTCVSPITYCQSNFFPGSPTD